MEARRLPSDEELSLSECATVGWGFAFGSLIIPVFGVAALFSGASLVTKGRVGHGVGINIVGLALALISAWAWWVIWIAMWPGHML